MFGLGENSEVASVIGELQMKGFTATLCLSIS